MKALASLLPALAWALLPAPPALADGAAGAPADLRFEYWEGRSTITDYAGKVIAQRDIMEERILDHRHKVVVERSLMRVPNGGLKEYIFQEQLTDAASFSVREISGGTPGKGTFEGPSWRWTGWKSNMAIGDGQTLETRATVTSESFKVHKVISGASAIDTTTIRDELTPIDADTFELRYYLWSSGT